MQILVSELSTIPQLQPDGTMKDESFATLRFFHDEKPQGQIKVHVSDLPFEVVAGDVLTLTK